MCVNVIMYEKYTQPLITTDVPSFRITIIRFERISIDNVQNAHLEPRSALRPIIYNCISPSQQLYLAWATLAAFLRDQVSLQDMHVFLV